MWHKKMVKQALRSQLRNEKIIFLKALMRSPLRTGAVIPSSAALGGFMCRHVSLYENGFVVEIGAGTGRLTRSLLHLGIDPNKLFVVEYEKDLCHFLQQALPGVNIIHGNALHLAKILPPEVVGQAHTIISGIPLMNFSDKDKEQLAEECLNVLQPNGQLLQFTYGLLSPLNIARCGLTKERLGAVFNNVPPAIVWRYRRNQDVSETTQPRTIEDHFVAAFSKIRQKVMSKL